MKGPWWVETVSIAGGALVALLVLAPFAVVLVAVVVKVARWAWGSP